jgi:hypothetical protein
MLRFRDVVDEHGAVCSSLLTVSQICNSRNVPPKAHIRSNISSCKSRRAIAGPATETAASHLRRSTTEVYTSQKRCRMRNIRIKKLKEVYTCYIVLSTVTNPLLEGHLLPSDTPHGLSPGSFFHPSVVAYRST